MSNATTRIALTAAVSLCVAGSSVALAANPNQPTVAISQGTLAGRIGANGVETFKGIPYAEPPVGDLRWKAPVAIAPWKGRRDASAFGASCIQPNYPPKSIYADNPVR